MATATATTEKPVSASVHSSGDDEDSKRAADAPVAANEALPEKTDNEVEKAAAPKPPQASVNDAAAIPNGGTQAWLQVLGAFFLFFNSWGE